MTMTTLITGASGQLGSQVVEFLRKWEGPANLIATSREASNAARFESEGIRFRVADFSKSDNLSSAFEGVDKLLIISTPDYDTGLRSRLQNNAIDAAIAAKVGHVYFTSTAWGGYQDASEAYIQQSALTTEANLKKSGLKYTIIREGIYADYFKLFLNYSSDGTEILLPGDGQIAWAARRDLAEGTARILQSPSEEYTGKTVLLTGSKTASITDVAKLVADITGKDLPVRRISADDFIAKSLVTGQSEWLVRMRLSHYAAVEAGELATVSPLLEQLLGRPPTQVEEIVKRTILPKPDA